MELKDVDERVSVRFACGSQAVLEFSCDWIHIESVTYGHIDSP
ncbi:MULTISPECIES: hypothetical protein [Burkholderia]